MPSEYERQMAGREAAADAVLVQIKGRRIRQEVFPVPGETFNIRVVEVTPALKREIMEYGLSYHLWRGYPIIEYPSDEFIVRRRVDASQSKLEPLRYLLSWDYENAICELQIKENK